MIHFSVIWPSVLILLNCQLNTRAVEDFPWTTVEMALAQMCSSVEVCGRTIGWNVSVPSSRQFTCCKDCSCEGNCEELGDCCFPQAHDEHIGKCMYPRTRYQFQALSKDEQSIYIIDTPPPNGCVTGNSIGCTENDMLQPVSSESTGFVYSNEYCALCHGAGVLKQWEPALNCEMHRSTDSIDIFSELILFVKNPETSLCYLSFSFSGDNYSNLKGKTCNIYRNVSQISDYDHINTINWPYMTEEEIGNICFSGFNLPFYNPVDRVWYRNPFCFLYERGPPISTCNEYFRVGQDMSSFAALLKVDTISQAVSQDMGLCKSCNQEVCQGNIKTSKHRSRCRPVYCPTGQMFDLEGNCVVITDAMSMSGRRILSIQIRLTALGVEEHNVNDFKSFNVVDIEMAIPWSTSWRIAFLALAHHEGSNITGTPDLLMILETSQGSLRSNIDDVKLSLSRRFVLTIDGNETIFNQTIYHQKVGRFVETDKIRTTFVSDYVTTNGLAVDLADIDLTIWEELYLSSSYFYEKIMLSKLYLCPQIELAPDEFLLLADQRLLYHLESGVYFYEREFHLHQNGNVTTARICAEQIGYSVHDQSSGCHSWKYTEIFCFLVYGILPALILDAIIYSLK